MSGIMSMLLGAVSSAAAVTDAFFNRVTLLLNTSSTNGAQNNTFLDSSSNNFSITRNGNTTQGTFTPFSQTGWSNYFDGSGDYLLTPSNAAFNPSGSDITVDFFVYLTRYPNVNNIVFEIGTSTSGDVQCNIINTGTVRFSIGGSVGSTISGFTLNTWHYVTCVKSGTNFTVYLNGTAGTTVSLTANSKTQMYIGSQSGGNAIDGYLSNFRFVKGSANVPSGVPTTPLTNITNTSLLTCQDNRFIDNSTANSGSGFTLTPNGNVSVQAFSPFAPTAAYSTTTVGGSGYFDSNGDYLSLTNETAYDFGAGDFSIDFWYYPISAQNYATIYNRDGQDYPLAIYSGSSITPAFPECGLAAGTTTTWFVTDLFTSGVKTQSWNHIAFTRVGNTWRAFTNGVLSTVKTASGTIGSGGIPWIAKNGTAAGQSELSMNLSSFRMVKGGIPTLFSTSSTTTGTQIFSPPTSATSNSESLTAGSLSLLLNFTNAGIFDAAAKNVLETVGNAQVSTTQTKFGTTSMAFDGTGDQLLLPYRPTLDLASGDWTIEGWLYLNSVSPTTQGVITLFNGNAVSQTNVQYIIRVNTSNLVFECGISTTTYSISFSGITTGTWYHFAMVRNGTTMMGFLNGTKSGTTPTLASNLNTSTTWVTSIGRYTSGGTNYDLNGYIDDLRITKGVARYTANFTAPTAAFPVQ